MRAALLYTSFEFETGRGKLCRKDNNTFWAEKEAKKKTISFEWWGVTFWKGVTRLFTFFNYYLRQNKKIRSFQLWLPDCRVTVPAVVTNGDNSFKVNCKLSLKKLEKNERRKNTSQKANTHNVLEARLVSSCLSWPSSARPHLSLLLASSGVSVNTLDSVKPGATWHPSLLLLLTQLLLLLLFVVVWGKKRERERKESTIYEMI